MKQNEARAVATIAALTPTSGGEASFRALKNAVRLHGSHLMAMRRPSKTPEASRKYVYGDPVGMIDWRAYARTDQLIIRERRDEASARVAIGIDISETMRWPLTLEDAVEPPPQKWELAMRLALHVAYGHLRLGDTVLVQVFGDEQGQEYYWRPRSSTDIVDMYTRLSRSEFKDTGLLIQGFLEQPLNGNTCDVGFLITDALGGQTGDIFWQNAKRKIFFHVLSSLEDDISWIEGQTCYFDEGRGRKEYQGEILLRPNGYQKALSKWRSNLKGRTEKAAGDYCYFTDRTPLSQYLGLLEDLGKLASGSRGAV